MQVGSINNQTFGGKIAKTKQGNEYEKSNEGKKFVPVAGVAAGAVAIGTYKATGLIDPLLKAVNKLSKDPLTKNTMKKFNSIAKLSIPTITLAGLFATGMVFDAMINKTRRKDADKLAESEIMPENTNKGKIIGAITGLVAGGLGLLSLTNIQKPAKQEIVMSSDKALNKIFTTLSKVKFKPSKALKIAYVPLAIAAYTAFGAVYDHGVNKARKQMTEKTV